ncbi:EF-P lysine aminoacylase GenX [Alkalispirochaeta americana]|nr:amino acid--tRNA ligase-related protein [Alkalispirochaeta americana]
MTGPSASIAALQARAEILRRLRSFFDTRGYLAVETPQLTRTPIPEAHIKLFATTLAPAGDPLFLLPSPEYHLKQLLAAGSGSLYEITHSFRNAETPGPWHSPEFTMLEYYTVDADSTDSLHLTQDLLRELGETNQPLVISMEEAWLRWAGIGLAATLAGEERENRERLAREALQRGLCLQIEPGETWEDLFQRIFLSHVEPGLPRDRPVFLTGYPAAVPTLARNIPGTPWADRWELYLGGIEIANCFGEETSPAVIRQFLEEQSREKSPPGLDPGQTEEPWDPSFLQPPAELPRSSGVALGVDRLVMHLLKEDSLKRVISFTLFE